MARVIVDAGHGGFDNGASYEGRLEKDDNLNLALAVGNILRDNGVDVEFTRTEDVYQSPSAKARIANELGGDLLVSIHRNSAIEPNLYQGVQSLVYNKGGISEAVGNDINERLTLVGFDNLGVEERKNLAVLHQSSMPAVLVEVGFINSDEDNRILDNNFLETADAIAQGILSSFVNAMNTAKDQEEERIYSVQVRVFSNQGNAMYFLEELEEQGFQGFIVPMADLFSVQVGEFDQVDDAMKELANLKKAGYEGMIVTLT